MCKFACRIKGLCEATEYDIEYTWNWLGYNGVERLMRYMGPMNSSIFYAEDEGTWQIEKVNHTFFLLRFHSNFWQVYEDMHKPIITIYRPRISMGLGKKSKIELNFINMNINI